MSSSPTGDGQAREHEALRCFYVSALLLLIPAASLWWTMSRAQLPHVTCVILAICWLASGVAGLLYAMRSKRFADRKTNGYGILALVLHIGSLMLLSIIVAGSVAQ